MYYEKLQKLYTKIDLPKLQTINADSEESYAMTIKVAFVKSLQLNQLLHNKIENEDSFLFLSILRGTCEELIVLEYIKQLIAEKDRNALVNSLLKAAVKKELIEQTHFIQKYRPAQPVLTEKVAEFFPGEEIFEILSRNGINGKSLPPTEQMAKKVGLEELYNYMYRASCSFVHFNPRIMLRTIWYENEQPEQSSISINNFNKYYFSFCSFYGSYLFGLIFKKFKNYLEVSKEDEVTVNKIIEIVRRTIHYPELVTYEECNLKRPKTELTIINDFLKDQLFDKE